MKKIIIFNDHKVSYHNSIYNRIFETNDIKKYKLHYLFYKRLNEFNKKYLWELNEYEFNKYFKEKFKINYAKGSYKLIKIYNIVKYILSIKPNFIFLQGYTDITNLIIILFSKLIGAKVLWRGEFYNNELKTSLMKKVYLKIFFKFCNLIFFSTTKSHNYIKIFYNGITYPMITSAPEFYRPLQYNYSSDKINIIFVGEISQRKNILLTAKVISNSRFKDNINFLICGAGEDLQELLAILKKNKISYEHYENCKPDKLLYLYNIADFLILLSEYDPSPKVCNEAFNCHLPMFLSDKIGSINDFEFDKEIIFKTNPNSKTIGENFNFFCENINKYKINYKKIRKNLLNTKENAKAFFKSVEIIT